MEDTGIQIPIRLRIHRRRQKAGCDLPGAQCACRDQLAIDLAVRGQSHVVIWTVISVVRVPEAVFVPAPDVHRLLYIAAALFAQDQDLFRLAVCVPVDHHISAEPAGDHLCGVFYGLLQCRLGNDLPGEAGGLHNGLGEVRFSVAKLYAVVPLRQDVILDLYDLRLRLDAKVLMYDRDGVAEVDALQRRYVFIFFGVRQIDERYFDVIG